MLYNIKDIRLKNNLTQEELAKKANISRATVIKLESGEEMEVKISTLEALADALDCPVSAFFMQQMSSVLDKGAWRGGGGGGKA